jgi:hypothetical protein
MTKPFAIISDNAFLLIDYFVFLLIVLLVTEHLTL